MHGGEAIAICEFGKDADVAAVFELDAWRAVRLVSRALMRDVRTSSHGGRKRWMCGVSDRRD